MLVELSKQDLSIILECLHGTMIQGRSAKRFAELTEKIAAASVGVEHDSGKTKTAELTQDLSD